MCLSCGCHLPVEDHADSRHITALMLKGAADAAGISLEQAAENIVLALSGVEKGEPVDTPYAACRIVEKNVERQFTLGVAYPAMKADRGRAADGFRDFVSPEVLEKTAHQWLLKNRDVNLFHQENTLGHFTPAESYIWRGPDWSIDSPVDGKPYVVKKGSWMLGGYWDDYGWTLVKAGLVNGWSPEGGARRSVPTPERLALVEV